MPAPDPDPSRPPLDGGRLPCLQDRRGVRRVPGGHRGVADTHRARLRGPRDTRRSAPRAAGRTTRPSHPSRRRDRMTPSRPAPGPLNTLAGIGWLIVGVTILAGHWALIDWLVLTLT